MNKNEKKIYQSPTTPGLYIDFWNLVVETICLNMNPKLEPKFWSGNKYWSSKYAREISVGIKKFKCEIKEAPYKFDTDKKYIQSIILDTITKDKTRSLINNKTRKKILEKIRHTHNHKLISTLSNKNLSVLDYSSDNFKFVDAQKNTKFNKIKNIENG